MGISDKIRWRRHVNEMRFIHNEKDLIEEINVEAATAFHEHFLNFAGRHNLNIKELNKKNRDHLDNLYNADPSKILPPNFSDLSGSQCEALIPYQPPSENPPPSEYEMTQDDIEIHESFRKLFKKLAMRLHPDKINHAVTIEQGMENIKLFKEASEALDNKKYFILLDLAEKLKITQSRNYKQQTRWMKKEVKRLEDDVRQHKSSYNYIFSECDNDQQKDNLMKSFILQLFKIQVP